MDLVNLVTRFQVSCPDGYAIIEHLSNEQIPKAKSALDAAMLQAGLEWDESFN